MSYFASNYTPVRLNKTKCKCLKWNTQMPTLLMLSWYTFLMFPIGTCVFIVTVSFFHFLSNIIFLSGFSINCLELSQAAWRELSWVMSQLPWGLVTLNSAILPHKTAEKLLLYIEVASITSTDILSAWDSFPV